MTHDDTVPWQVIDDVGPLVRATHRRDFPVTDAIIDTYRRDGVVHVPGAFVEWVDPLRAGLDRNMASPAGYAFPSENLSADEPGRFFESYCNWQRIGEYLAFVLSSGAASLAARLMESPSAQFFHDHAFSKEGGTAKATPWHQDLPYYCVDGTRTASVYVSLDDAPAETAIRFVRGSHRWGDTFAPRRFVDGHDYPTDGPSLPTVPDIDDDSRDVISGRLEPGDAVVFDFRTLHGSTAAPVERRRRAFSTRWLGEDVVYCERPSPTSPPLTDLETAPGAHLPEDRFPILWP